jgi:hypothetical protein
MIPERREHARSRLSLRVRFRALVEHGDPGFWEQGELVDLSLSGACFRSEVPLREGAALELIVAVGHGRPELPLTAHCVRAAADGVAVRFSDLAADSRAMLGACLADFARVRLAGKTRRYTKERFQGIPPGRTTEVL